ncbi:MAG: hypothetical protein U9O94_06980 [Nanoarchaeota archaeon]|nr:hypothetical protein [Nanoarchaeota archaeon]
MIIDPSKYSSVTLHTCRNETLGNMAKNSNELINEMLAKGQHLLDISYTYTPETAILYEGVGCILLFGIPKTQPLN